MILLKRERKQGKGREAAIPGLSRPASARSKLFRRSSLAAILIILFVLVRTQESSSAATPEEYRLKTAFVFNFLRFVEFDKGPGEALCIVGKDPFDGQLERSRASFGFAQLEIVSLGNDDDFESCRFVFVGQPADEEIPELVRRLDGRPVLTIGDAPGFVDRGGMIGLVMNEGKVQFEINQNAARQNRVFISSKLLNLASRVIGAKSS